MYTTVTRELTADDTTYGAIIDDLLDTLPIANVQLDMTTPASASSPRLAVTVPDQARDDLAKAYGYSDWEDLLADDCAEVTIHE